MIVRSTLNRSALKQTVILCVALLVLGGVALFSKEQASPANDQQNQGDNTQEADILRRVRTYADEYIQKLPDFICLQKTAQFEGNKKGSKWKEGDTIASKLVFSEGKERRTLQSINGRAPSPQGLRRSVRRPLTTNGEFGILMANVLGSESDATYQWQGWHDLAGKKMAVFGYNIDREHSTVKLSLNDLATAVVAYHGVVFADPANGKVWRISSEAMDIPKELNTRSIITVIDYQQVTIGTADYLMPGKASILMVTRANQVRNELSFSGFQKFEAGSTITFGDTKDTQPAAPSPPNSPPQ